MNKRESRAAVIKAESGPMDRQSIIKAESFRAIDADPFKGLYSSMNIIEPPYPLEELNKMVEYSTILQQCIEAYKRNIVGYGVDYKYKEDETATEETPLMKAEWQKLKDFVQYFNFDKSFEDVWGQAIEHREKTGNGYLEIIRDGTGLPVGGDNVDPTTIRLTARKRATVTYIMNGKKFTRQKYFRKYVQIVSGSQIWFKEFGDPRFMNSETGDYTPGHNGDLEANEILHLKIGDGAYGVPRWIGQLIHMYGARKAEELNYNYFINGRHTPAAVVVSNGLLTKESIDKLTDYANSVKGTDNAHRFLVLEAEGLEDGVLPGEDRQGVKVEIKSLADILQNDALFLEYDDASRLKVQSAFRLPDIYVGRSKDYNRATADTAKRITEEQVFEPERKSLEFIINNILLYPYQLQSALLGFKPQIISDVEDMVKMLTILNTVGAIAPNDVRDKVGEVLDKELEPFDMEEANLPAALRTAKQIAEGTLAPYGKPPGPTEPPKKKGGSKIVATKKELTEGDFGSQMINVMKDVRDVLEEIQDGQFKQENK